MSHTQHTQHFSDLLELSHKELVAHLRFYNFPGSALSGKKVQLAARLLDHLEEFGQTPDTQPPRTYLMVPYRCRQRAKQLGAKWDPIWKSWYAPAYSRDVNRLTRVFLLRESISYGRSFTRTEGEQDMCPPPHPTEAPIDLLSGSGESYPQTHITLEECHRWYQQDT